ncbi:GNAT family N-acetyltransferase [Actinocorallia sp. B10E7]|uniref:GNAT family N-acetyltransferase n=1 Tax=Actinocorallia sp. B10E7 TaxID=3153558 RepID=UPI00325CC0FA
MRFLAPATHLVPSYLEAMKEHDRIDGRPDADGLTWSDLEGRTLEGYTADLASGAYPRPGVEYGVAGTELWWCRLSEQGQASYVGRASIRHHVVPLNRRWGGNLWWSVRPSLRGRGLGTQLLQEVLPLLAGHGINEPTITVLQDDVARRRALAKAGAVELGTRGGFLAYQLLPQQLPVTT